VAPDLYGYVSRICTDAEESNDVFQEAFARLLGSAFSADNDLDRRRYLFRIATNLIRDRKRWSRRWGLDALRDRSGRSPESGYADRLDVERGFRDFNPNLAHCFGWPTPTAYPTRRSPRSSVSP